MNPRVVTDMLRTKLDSITFHHVAVETLAGKPTMKRAFFPGGNGLYRGEHAEAFPVHGTLILGTNFGCVDGFITSDGRLMLDDETAGPTWSPLRRRLSDAGIDIETCFFTNAWPFLHRSDSNIVGGALLRSWLKDANLIEQCHAFFQYTCKVMQPILVIALGPAAAAFLGYLKPEELGTWRATSMEAMTTQPIGQIEMGGVPHEIVCTALVHPSGQHYNVGKREPPYVGAEGEVQMLREADRIRKSTLL